MQFRRGRHTIHERHYLLDLGLDSRDAAKKMSGKDVEWKSESGKIIKGKISDAHGNKGLVRAIFERGLPGQAVTTNVEVHGEAPKEEKKKDDGKKELSGIRGEKGASEVKKDVGSEKVDMKEEKVEKKKVVEDN